MLSIGEFSRVAQLTVKALRHYHELGILVPERVDEETGYRYYGRSSYERARIIHGLKELGFSLAEISSLLAEVSEDGELVPYLEQKLRQIESGIREHKKMQKRIQAFLSSVSSAGYRPHSSGRLLADEGVSETIMELEVPEWSIFGLRFYGKYSDVGRMIGALYRQVGRFALAGPFAMYYDAEYKESDVDIEVAVEVRKTFSGETPSHSTPFYRRARAAGRGAPAVSCEAAAARGVNWRVLPGGRAVALVHLGPYEAIGASYRRLFEYMNEKGYSPKIPIREIYLKGPGLILRGDPMTYRTRLMIFYE